jgi:hypothetical protein
LKAFTHCLLKAEMLQGARKQKGLRERVTPFANKHVVQIASLSVPYGLTSLCEHLTKGKVIRRDAGKRSIELHPRAIAKNFVSPSNSL